VTSLQRKQYGKGHGGNRITLQQKNLTNTASARRPRSTSALVNPVDGMDP